METEKTSPGRETKKKNRKPVMKVSGKLRKLNLVGNPLKQVT